MEAVFARCTLYASRPGAQAMSGEEGRRKRPHDLLVDAQRVVAPIQTTVRIYLIEWPGGYRPGP